MRFVATIGFCCISAWAQNPSAPLPDPSDPTVFVPPVAYRSVFVDTPTGVEQTSADWKRANAEVGQFKRGHIDILKWEAEQANKPKASGGAAPSNHHHHHGKQP